MIEETWLMACVEEVRKRIRTDRSTMIDVGANRGDWTALLKDDFSCVVAYEPDGRLVEGLTARFAGDKNVWVLQQAVGATEGPQCFYERDGIAQSSLSEDHPFGHGRVTERYMVDVVTLPKCIDIWCDFVKVDIEGGESVLEYPDNVTCYLIECHGTFSEVLHRLPREYAVWRVKHPHRAADADGHCWAFAVREVPRGVAD